MDRVSQPRFRRIAPVVAVAAAAALTLAGCSSSSGGKKSEEGGGDASAGKATTPRMTVALVTHQSPGDTFWDIVRKGAQAAAAKDNIKLIYSADPNAGNQSNLVQNAIDQKVDGIAVTLAKRHIALRNVEDLLAYSVAAFQNANVILGPRFKAVAASHPDYKEYPQQITQDKMLFTGHVVFGWSLVGVLVAFASLEAGAGFCAGCFVYARLQARGWLPADACVDCAPKPESRSAPDAV